MSLHEMERIKELFSKLDLHPTYLEHEPVVTSEDAAKTRGFELKQGIKALLFTNGRGDWVIVNVPAHKKAHLKKIAEMQGWSKKEIRMATPDEVVEITGCEVGSVPPFGHKAVLPLLVDRGVYENTESTFNIGLRTNSVRVPTQEMKILFTELGVREGDFVKEDM